MLEALSRVLAESPQFTESRKASLYSNFGRLQKTNPDGFDANIKAWKGVLLQSLNRGCFEDKCAITAGQPLLEAFSDVKWGIPLALNTVFDELVKDKDLVSSEIFLGSSLPVLKTSWRPWSLTKAGLGWVASHIIDMNWHSGELGTLRSEKYIVVERLAGIANDLLAKLRAEMYSQGNSWCSRVFFADDCHKIYPGLSDLDLQCCLIYLSREKGIIGYDKTINTISLSGNITEDERFLSSVRQQLRELNARHAALERQIISVNDEAKAYVVNDKARARRLCRSKATLERSAKHVSNLVDQLETVLQKLDESHDNVRSIEALKQSNKLLAKSTAQTELDSVDKLIDDLQANFSLADDMSEAVSGLNLKSPEEDIEEELEEIEREAITDEQLDNLPNAPTDKPISNLDADADANANAKQDLPEKKKATPLAL